MLRRLRWPLIFLSIPTKKQAISFTFTIETARGNEQVEEKDKKAVTDIPLRVQLLGGFQVWVEGELIPASRWRRKSAALVKLLALSPAQRLHREEVLEQLWPERSSKAALNNLHATLHAARRSLELPTPAPYLRFAGDLLVLDPSDRVCVDVALFLRHSRQARRTRHEEDYEQALELYQGELLPEDRYHDWSASLREELLELYLDLSLELADLYERQENCGAALEVLRRVVAAEPALEAAYLALMRLYLRLGQPQAALLTFEKLRRTLRREFGSGPSSKMRQLYQSVLERLAHE